MDLVLHRPLHAVRQVTIVLVASLFMALASQLAILLPFTPVPIVLAPSLAVMLGVVLGPRMGALSVILFLVEGAAGLPFFSAGRGGLLHLLGPTGGYLVGYAIAAYIAGSIASRQPLSRGRLALAVTAGYAALYGCGVCVLAHYVGWAHVLMAGVIPFLPGCIVKTVALASLLPRRILSR